MKYGNRVTNQCNGEEGPIVMRGKERDPDHTCAIYNYPVANLNVANQSDPTDGTMPCCTLTKSDPIGSVLLAIPHPNLTV